MIYSEAILFELIESKNAFVPVNEAIIALSNKIFDTFKVLKKPTVPVIFSALKLSAVRLVELKDTKEPLLPTILSISAESTCILMICALSLFKT